MKFRDKLDAITKKNNSLLCIGLDTELVKLPKFLQKAKNPLFEFNKAIIDATAREVCAYKPNIAFFEASGIDGLQQLKQTIEYIHIKHPKIPIVLDAKRGDIPNTARMYAKAIYEYWDVDATTIYPNLGFDSVEPFLKYKDKLTILLLKTSNPDSGTFQNVKVNKKPYYLNMSEEITKWKRDNIGMFVGATYPQELANVRKIFPDKIFLSAGLGAQSAEIEKAIEAGVDKDGKGIMFNASRSIIYASMNKDFAQYAQDKARKLNVLINKFR